jgi:predicted acyl esterase
VLSFHVTYPPGVTSVEIAERLWDVTPGSAPNTGTQSLISRAVYRIDYGLTPPTSPVDVPVNMELWPNAYQLTCGHTLKLELTQDDSPTWRPDNVSSALTYTNLSLSLPVVQGTGC